MHHTKTKEANSFNFDLYLVVDMSWLVLQFPEELSSLVGMHGNIVYGS